MEYFDPNRIFPVSQQLCVLSSLDLSFDVTSMYISDDLLLGCVVLAGHQLHFLLLEKIKHTF